MLWWQKKDATKSPNHQSPPNKLSGNRNHILLMKKTVSLKVSGKVQGVGFRYYTKKKAQECNVNGFVQNKPDGSVYIEANGEKIDIDTFTDWCIRGPDWARVIESRISELPDQEWDGFSIN